MPETQSLTDALARLDPSMTIKARWLRRKIAGIVAVGATVLNPPAPEPTRAHDIVAAKRQSVIGREHRATIEVELAEIDKHRAAVEARLGVGDNSFQAQELAAERRQLTELKSMIAADQDNPIRTDRDGREIDDQTRAYIKMRSRELASHLWENADAAARTGDHRRARQLRRDALRARHLAEYEMHLRAAPPGYGMSSWT